MWPNASIKPNCSNCAHNISPSLWCPGGASCALGMGLRMGSRAVAWSQASLWVQRAVGTGEERRFWRSRWGGRYPAKRQGKLKAGAIEVLFSLFPFLFSPLWESVLVVIASRSVTEMFQMSPYLPCFSLTLAECCEERGVPLTFCLLLIMSNSHPPPPPFLEKKPPKNTEKSVKR